MKICIIKIGTDTIIQDGQVDIGFLDKLKLEIEILNNKQVKCVLVCSGAVAIGRNIMNNILKDNRSDNLRVMAAIGQPYLIEMLNKYIGHIVAQVLVTSHDFINLEVRSVLSQTMFEMLDMGIIPVINENDLLSNEELDQVPLFNDNDALAVNIASIVSAKWLVIMSAGIDGLYINYDNKELGIYRQVSNVEELLIGLSDSKSTGGRGGMHAKLLSIKKAIDNYQQVYLINGYNPSNISKSLLRDSEFVGTVFKIDG